MTRINTNVSSLVAQKTLQRSEAELETSLQRLSTGLKINSGKDDPAGLIASEILRSDIAATNVAISNCERANQMISTADSSLAEVGNLLIEIRALVSEAANEGAMSAEQIAANQLQVDSSLAAIDRIAQVTQFQGNRLLDGSLDFVTENVNSAMLDDVQVHQATFGNLSGDRRRSGRRDPSDPGGADLSEQYRGRRPDLDGRRQQRVDHVQFRGRHDGRRHGLGHQHGLRRSRRDGGGGQRRGHGGHEGRTGPHHDFEVVLVHFDPGGQRRKGRG